MYNSLTNHAISDKSYEDVLNVWKVFSIKIMKNFHDLYLKRNVLLLVCVFETFRKEYINSFELDSGHCLSTLGYTWEAIKKFAKSPIGCF